MKSTITDMIEVKASELTGPALDYAVARAEGYELRRLKRHWQLYRRGIKYGHFYPVRGEGFAVGRAGYWQPSVAWSQGGPLIDKHSPLFTLCCGQVRAEVVSGVGLGDTYLIAACRAIVTAKLGDTVQVPVELTTKPY